MTRLQRLGLGVFHPEPHRGEEAGESVECGACLLCEVQAVEVVNVMPAHDQQEASETVVSVRSASGERGGAQATDDRR